MAEAPTRSTTEANEFMEIHDGSRRSVLISGVILAAGRSKRMGRPKLALPLGGKPILQHALDAAAESCLDEIVVVLAPMAEALLDALELPRGPTVRIAINPKPDAGQSRSLQCGLAATSPQSDAAAIMLGDQPGLTGKSIDQILEAFTHTETPALRPLYSGARGEAIPGHPVVLARSLWREVETLRGDEGLRSMFLQRPEWLTAISTPGAPPADIDTLKEYRRAENALLTGK
jgi:molybdenum cofactor cytidylyltransferase